MTETHQRGRVRVETGPKRVRAFLGGSLVADTLRPLLVWEVPYYPAYYIPAADVHAELIETGETEHSPSRGTAEIYDVLTDGGVAKAAAILPESQKIAGLACFYNERVDVFVDGVKQPRSA